MITLIKNGKLITDKIEAKNVYIKDGKILAITNEDIAHDAETDAKGMYVSPGFIDLHTHGGGGCDFADGEVSDILTATDMHLSHGTTTIFPTCTSASHEDTLNFIKNTGMAMKRSKSHIGGAHLEGPYFSKIQAGAQNPNYIREPKKEEYDEFISEGKGVLRRISFAPELSGAAKLLDCLNENKIVAAFGHTDCIYDELLPFIKNGCCLATHLYSGMNAVTRRNMYRYGGAVESALLEDSVYAELIADGCHLPTELLKLVYKIKGADKIALVTDSMRAAGMPEGRYVLGAKADGLECISDGRVAMLPDLKSFAGSIATADRLVRTMRNAGIPLCDCIKMMSKTPAKIMNLSSTGELKEGLDADILIFDDEINIKKIILGGICNGDQNL